MQVEEKNSCFLCRQPSLWMLQGEVSNITGLPSDLETHLLMEKHPDLLPEVLKFVAGETSFLHSFIHLFFVKFISKNPRLYNDAPQPGGPCSIVDIKAQSLVIPPAQTICLQVGFLLNIFQKPWIGWRYWG